MAYSHLWQTSDFLYTSIGNPDSLLLRASQPTAFRPISIQFQHRHFLTTQAELHHVAFSNLLVILDHIIPAFHFAPPATHPHSKFPSRIAPAPRPGIERLPP